MGQPVVHFEISTNKRDAAEQLKGFYGELFEWKIDSDNPQGYGMVDTGGGGINGGIHGIDNIPPYLTFFVQVDDVQGALDKAVELGATIVTQPTDMEGIGTFAQFRDPENNLIGLWKP